MGISLEIFLVAYGCCSKLPQVQWVNATQMYYRVIPEVRISK